MTGVDSCQVDCYFRGQILTKLIAMAGGEFLQGWFVWQGWIPARLIVIERSKFS